MEHLLRVTTWHRTPKGCWYASSTQDYWLEPAKVIKSPLLLIRSPDVLEEVDRNWEQYYTDKDRGEREWIAWYALSWWKRVFTRSPSSMKPLSRKYTMKEMLEDV